MSVVVLVSFRVDLEGWLCSESGSVSVSISVVVLVSVRVVLAGCSCTIAHRTYINIRQTY